MHNRQAIHVLCMKTDFACSKLANQVNRVEVSMHKFVIWYIKQCVLDKAQ